MHDPSQMTLEIYYQNRSPYFQPFSSYNKPVPLDLDGSAVTTITSHKSHSVHPQFQFQGPTVFNNG